MSESNLSNLSIVLPCYNPQEKWERNVLNNYLETVKILNFEPSLVLVNDGSTVGVKQSQIDFLQEKLGKNFTCHLLPENKGKGAALRAGVALTNTQNIIFTDIDFP